jgi:hypothetical protein
MGGKGEEKYEWIKAKAAVKKRVKRGNEQGKRTPPETQFWWR